MNKIIKNISIVIVTILAIFGILFIIGQGQEEKVVTDTKESKVLDSAVAVEEPIKQIDSDESEIYESESSAPFHIEAKPTDVELEVREEMLNSFNENLIGVGFVTYSEEYNGFILNMTDEAMIIEVAEALEGDKTYWNTQIRDPYIDTSIYIQEQLGGTHPFMLKNPASDSYLLIVINGVVAYDQINGVEISAE